MFAVRHTYFSHLDRDPEPVEMLRKFLTQRIGGTEEMENKKWIT